MGFCVQRQGARAALGGHGFDYRKLIGRILMNYRQRALAIRTKCKARLWIECSAVGSASDRKGGYYFTVFGIDHNH